jgi:hypothetical protein
MQHDLFHVYTVDQHILMVLRNVRRFFIPEHAHEYPFCSQLAANWDKPWLLYIAALFHDVAKGRGGDHSELGAVEVRRFCRDHGLDKTDTGLVEFLVREHLTMSRVAQKEDLSDPDVVARFAQKMGDARRLTGLYLLTVADMRGTSPKVWNAWKAKLLEDLFRMTLRALGGARPMPTPRSRPASRSPGICWPCTRPCRAPKSRCGTRWSSATSRGTTPPTSPGMHARCGATWKRRSPSCGRALQRRRRPAGAGLCAGPAGPVRAHLRLLRRRRLLDPGRQGAHHQEGLRWTPSRWSVRRWTIPSPRPTGT